MQPPQVPITNLGQGQGAAKFGAAPATRLSGQARFSEVVQKTDVEHISLITGGMIPPNPSELLAGRRMTEFLKVAKEGYDFVLLDTPPIAILTDAVVISEMVDGVIIVVDSGKTSKKILRRIYQLLNDAKAKVTGVVLNRVSLTSGDYYYYSYYAEDVKQKAKG